MSEDNDSSDVHGKWRLSFYTRVVQGSAGDLLLHNSFMGAVARVPGRLRRALAPYLEGEFDRADADGDAVRALCDAGFFVPAAIDERTVVDDILTRERESGFHIIVLPHENCNFRCVYCYESFERGKMKPAVAAGLKAFVAGKAREIRSLSIAWFGGEPLLARDLLYDLSDSFIADCERNGVAYSSGITTNGFLLGDEVVDALLARRVTSYQVTLDGPERLHNRSRMLAGGGETYRRILGNLDAMHRRGEEFAVKLRVNFGPRHTAEAIQEFLAELRRRFDGDSRFDLHFHPVGKWGGPNDSELEVCDARSVGARRAALARDALGLGFPGRMLEDRLRPHGNVCYAGKASSIVVGSDGKVYKCTVAFDDPVNQVGQITGQGELVVDQRRWDAWTRLDDKDVGKCGACSFGPTCQSRGCPLVAIKRGEPPCPLTLQEYEDTVRLVAQRAVAHPGV